MKADAPPVQNLINRIFRCRHRRTTIPFTPRGEDQCYAVCLDCGQKIVGRNPVFASAADPVQATPSPEVAGEPPRPVTTPKPVTAPSESKQKPQKSARSAPKRQRKETQKRSEALPEPRPEAPSKDSSRGIFSFRDGRYNLLWVALFVVGLSGGLYFSRSIQPQPAAVPPAVQGTAPIGERPVSGDSGSHAGLPDEHSRAPAASPEGKPAAEKTAAGTAPGPPAESADMGLKRHLVGKNSLVILGMAEPDIRELSQHPGRLPELVQSGSLFTVPRGAAVQIQAEQDSVLKVVLLDGSMAGREGWIQASQVAPRYRSPGPFLPANQ
jgi:hypothetical protein